MPRECNIDARGKFLRLVGGSISLTMAIIAVGLLYLGLSQVTGSQYPLLSVFLLVVRWEFMKVAQAGVLLELWGYGLQFRLMENLSH